VRELVGSGALIASGWYDIRSYRELLHAVIESRSESPQFARTLAHHNAARDFRGIYRLLCFTLTPEALIKRTPALFARYRRGGRALVLTAIPMRAEVRFEDCHGFDRACWQESLGAMEAVLEACGGKNVALTVLEGGADDDTMLRVDARWAT
jgi:hypothetical protein